MMETVYKVVRVDESSGKRYSCMHWYDTPDKLCLDTGIVLEYAQGRITKPKFGKILAFDNLTDAKSFAGVGGLTEVWKCATPRFAPVLRVSLIIKPFECLLLYWKGESNLSLTMPAPFGAVACPYICLKELLIRNG